MKKLILILILMITSLSISQELKTNSTPVKTEEVSKEIDSIVERSKEDAENIKLALEKNREKLKEIEKIDSKEAVLLDKLVYYFKKNKNKNSKSTVITKKSEKPKSEIIIVKSTPDSICVQTYRPFLGEKKCIKWTYLSVN